MSPGQIKLVVTGVVQDLNTNHIVSFAASLSYYFVLAFFPALITLAAIVAYLPIPDLFTTIISIMARIAPPESMGLIRQIAADVITPSRGAFLSFGLLGTLWTCSSGFAEIIEALNVAYDVPETRPFWKTRLLALELLFVSGTLVTMAFVFLIAGPRFGDFLASYLGLAHAFAAVWPVLRYVLAVSFSIVAVVLLYLLAPNLNSASLPACRAR